MFVVQAIRERHHLLVPPILSVGLVSTDQQDGGSPGIEGEQDSDVPGRRDQLFMCGCRDLSIEFKMCHTLPLASACSDGPPPERFLSLRREGEHNGYR